MLLFFLPNALASSPQSNDSEASVCWTMFCSCVKIRMLFTPYDQFLISRFHFFFRYVCDYFLYLCCVLCEMFLSFGIIQWINFHTARHTGQTKCGSLGICGSERGHVLSLSFLLCPDPVAPLFLFLFPLLCFVVRSWLISHSCWFCLYCFSLPEYVFLSFHWFFRSLVCSCK